MVLQLEDVVDVLRLLYNDEYNFVFYFNHSVGHDCHRPDGLNGNEMNKSYGGAQCNEMQSTEIKDDTYLGPHLRLLQLGDIQCMQFR